MIFLLSTRFFSLLFSILVVVIIANLSVVKLETRFFILLLCVCVFFKWNKIIFRQRTFKENNNQCALFISFLFFSIKSVGIKKNVTVSVITWFFSSLTSNSLKKSNFEIFSIPLVFRQLTSFLKKFYANIIYYFYILENEKKENLNL